MMQPILSKKYFIFCLFIGMSLISCDCNDNQPKNSPSVDETGNLKPVTATAGTPLIASDSLDILWVRSAAFDTLDDKANLVFSFVFGQLDTLTMHGWSIRVNAKQFDSLPNIRLKKGTATDMLYGSGTYLGNLILDRFAIKSIKNLIKTKDYKYVLFNPTKLGENIRYNIFLDNDSLATVKSTMATSTTVYEVNPSPPKNY